MPVPLSFSPPERQGYNFGVKESIQVHNETGKDWGFFTSERRTALGNMAKYQKGKILNVFSFPPDYFFALYLLDRSASFLSGSLLCIHILRYTDP